MSTLIIRFSSLGDVALSAPVTAALQDVIYVTHRRYADLAVRLPGVREVIALEAGEGILGLASRIPPVSQVIDLHGSARSRALCIRLGRPTTRVQTAFLERRMRVALKMPHTIVPVVERYCRAAGVDVLPRPWIRLDGTLPGGALGLIPLAAHASKQWPMDSWVGLARGWDGPIIALGGPGEDGVLEQLQARAGREIEVVAEAGFERTFDAFGRMDVAVGGDTGLMHLAAICGVPVVGIYGPTTSRDGFWCHPGRSVEVSLGCRPCSRHGSELCPIGDHACMEGVSIGEVRSAIALLSSCPVEPGRVSAGGSGEVEAVVSTHEAQ